MALEVELEVLKSVVNKLDSSLEKISEVSNSIAKLLAVHDERLDSIEKTSDKKDNEIRDLHSRITTQTKEIVTKLEDVEKRLEFKMKENSESAKVQHEKIQEDIKNELRVYDKRLRSLEKWRWYVLGGAAALAFLLSNTPIAKFLHS